MKKTQNEKSPNANKTWLKVINECIHASVCVHVRVCMCMCMSTCIWNVQMPTWGSFNDGNLHIAIKNKIIYH